jgi:hypothetical protein
MSSPLKRLAFALEKYPERIDIAPLEDLLLESARQNPKRPAWVKLAVPDDLVKSLRGRTSDREVIFLVRIPKEISDRSDSRIVLPGEVG